MPIKFTKLSKILVIATIASMFSIEAKAEKIVEEVPLDEAFEAAYFTKGKNAFKQSTIWGQVNTIVGFTGFPEQHIATDAKKVDQLYRLSLERQASLGEPLRTRDLENPYSTSLRENPDYLSQ
ncbi:serine/threonine protein kinase [Pleurocapsales cyanobacterium LEGE 10410]|nr:serine/threonine protein kinase [Pleurocapsales cyanobacterium LEGE 10410]